jgi:hypothetical protein
MADLFYILGQPDDVDGKEIYPIRVKEWDKFERHANVLLYSKSHFENAGDTPLLYLLIFALRDEDIINSLMEVLKLSFRASQIDIMQGSDSMHFLIDGEFQVNAQNYDDIRMSIMKQNLMFEPKVYKDPIMQKWAERALAARNQGGVDITMEDMITTVSIFGGQNPNDMPNYSVYQLKALFSRVAKINEYQSQSAAMSNPYADLSKIQLVHFAEKVDMFKSPYDDLFKKDGNSNINKAMGK